MDNDPLTPTPSDSLSRTRDAKADPQIDFADLGLPTYGSDIDELDAGLIQALAPRHPRAFWAIAKQLMFRTHARDGAAMLAKACAHDERLIRLALATARKEVTYAYAHGDMTHQLLRMALELPSKSDAWREARIGENVPVLAKCSPDRTFSVLGSAARAGHLRACERIALLMPDKGEGPEQERQYRSGICGFAHMNMGSSTGRARAYAQVCSESLGSKSKSKARSNLQSKVNPLDGNKRDLPKNAIFWIAMRHRALSNVDPEQADAWGRVGSELIRRGLQVEESSDSLGVVMGCAPMLDALVARRPKLGSPSFYTFHRDEALFDALLVIEDTHIAKLCAYDETSPNSTMSTSFTSNGASLTLHPIPAAALALLAGRTPDPSWTSLGAERGFKISKSMLDAARIHTLSAKDLSDYSLMGRGSSYTIASLAAALAKPAKALVPPLTSNRESSIPSSSLPSSAKVRRSR